MNIHSWYGAWEGVPVEAAVDPQTQGGWLTSGLRQAGKSSRILSGMKLNANQ